MIEKLDSLPGLNYSFSQPVALRFNELLTGVREDIAVKVYGEDLDTLNMIGEKMVNVISKIKELRMWRWSVQPVCHRLP